MNEIIRIGQEIKMKSKLYQNINLKLDKTMFVLSSAAQSAQKQANIDFPFLKAESSSEIVFPSIANPFLPHEVTSILARICRDSSQEYAIVCTVLENKYTSVTCKMQALAQLKIDEGLITEELERLRS